MTPAEPIRDDGSMQADEMPVEPISEVGVPARARDLVSLYGGGPERSLVVRPLAGFLTQLLACRDGAPQMRARRRAGAGQVVSSYRVPAEGCGSRVLSKRV
jgi:hypothetical protein